MAQSEVDLAFFKDRGFGKLLGFGNKPCLIVADMITGFTDATMPMGSDLTSQISKVNRLLDTMHALDLPVIFTTISYDDDKLADSGLWYQKMEGLKTLKVGTTAVNVDSRLDFGTGDSLITKKYASSFFGTDLISRLNSNHVDTLIIVGCTTCGCVRATAVDALQYGYRPIVVEDAVGDRSLASHEQSLFDLEQKYADVLKTDKVIEAVLTKYGQYINVNK
ncbi:isochorismatase family protein [Aneurinibacillus sp. Ricciae_BoGa-3]|uniref:isochorismatase family protein n=1 Tax=Aneurinibacillus sp. Ricciae_BoGa-3 TaxID=3022697 RepID=UPI00234203CF|nr:isochorismatase family protein [Aneurinibacillus sp. Ricciae_BoGa-3]WCK53425.1 isochorismatase family protein [Aneurinibacillus sp. Ricciae_BoGa-3]